MYSRNLDLFLSVRVSRCCNSGGISQSPSQFKKMRGVFEQYFVLRVHVKAHRFPCARVFTQAFIFLISGCERLYIDTNIFRRILVSMALFLSVDIHQGAERFSVHSRGKQCAFMSLSALLTA